MSNSELFLPPFRDVEITPRSKDYLVDGKRYQRVTTALNIIDKPALKIWQKNVALNKIKTVLLNSAVQEELSVILKESPTLYNTWLDKLIASASKSADEISKTNATLGTEAHSLLQLASLMTEEEQELLLPTVPDDLRPAYDGGLDFLHDYKIKVKETELTVWDDELKVAGTIDGVGRNKIGKLVIWDWKRSASIYWQTALQLSAYSTLLSHLTGELVETAYAVRLPRSTNDNFPYEVKKLATSAFDAYEHAVHLQRAGNVKWWEK